jgi:ribonuclease VapC
VTVVVDSSAAAAIIFGEHEAGAVAEVMEMAGGALMCSATLVELSIVVERRMGPSASPQVERFLVDGEVEIVPLDRSRSLLAVHGWRLFGKGRHPAALNLGDCFTYALAKATGHPVLCIGNDFARTDVEVLPARS